MVENLLRMISTMRQQLVQLAIQKGSFTDAEVVMKSQELDQILNQYTHHGKHMESRNWPV